MEGKKLKFPDDIIAAVTGSIAALPDGMAAGTMAGVNPVQGLYSAIFGPLVGAWTTGSVHMMVTITSALAIATRGPMHEMSPDEKLSSLVLITVLAGVIQLLFGVFRMGFLVRFVSNSVMRGFLSGVSVSIILSQLADISGYYESKESNKIMKAIDVISHYKAFNFYTLGIGFLTIILIVLFNRTRVKHFSMFLAMIIASFVIYVFHITNVKLVGEEHDLSGGLPTLVFPEYSRIPDVIMSSFAIALIGFIQGAGVSHMKPNPDGSYPDISKDLRGEGLANIVCGIFSGIPVGGSVANTAVMTSAGACSRWANFISGILVAVFLYTMSGFIEMLPLTALAGILVLSGIESFNKEEIETIWETSIQARIIMMLTFIATLIVPIYVAVLGSVVLTFILHIVQASNRVTLAAIVQAEDGFYKEVPVPDKLVNNTVVLLHPGGSLFFAGAYVFEELLPDIEDDVKNSVVIIGLRGRKQVGSTFISVIKDYNENLRKHHCKLMLVGVGDIVLHQLDRTELLDKIGKENIYLFDSEIGRPMHEANISAQEWIKDHQ